MAFGLLQTLERKSEHLRHKWSEMGPETSNNGEQVAQLPG